MKPSDFSPSSRDAFHGQSAGARAILGRLAGVYGLYGFLRAGKAGRTEGGAASTVRLAKEEARILYRETDLYTLGALAHALRRVLHPGDIVTYIADRNINYSNVCSCACRFCAFFRPPGHPEAYVLSRGELAQKIRETIALGGTQILMQGGHNPDLPLGYYEELIAWIRAEFPSIHIHSFSPPEIVFFAEKEGLEIGDVIARLVKAGLHSIPGGGAEILSDRVRSLVSPRKCSAGQWLETMEIAHRLGLKTTATMMFGHLETDEERLEHLFVLRELQDKTGGFTAFIPWTFQPGSTRVKRGPESVQSYLRLLALSRLVLDNFPSLQVSWVTMGPHVAQLALFFGANDFGSLMIEENVVAAAGVSFRLSREQIRAIIGKAGFRPRQRRMDYSLMPEEENAP
ncbi:MAG: dehypoxanthine futalosine cyclase [Desulfovibrio sp.]|jgi:cyclic dehypoxanthinyl futalosine synthase|nr:dehypoxanthine futalosine cyclase [Desulfovibrio sp.]